MNGLEHVNITVSDPAATAAWLGRVFGWNVRWVGDAIDQGHTKHVGTETAYVALYTPPQVTEPVHSNYHQRGGLNHVGVTVDDLDATEAAVTEEGFTPRSHASYEPGRRFSFDDRDGIEWEVVSYA